MKDNKIPAWALYIADAIMLLAALFIALPNIKSGEPLSGGAVFLTCLIAFFAMVLSLVPFVLEYKKDMAKKAEHTQEAIENFKIIFDDLSALRLGLAEAEEQIEKLNDKIDFNDIQKNVDRRFADFEKAVVEFKDSVKSRFKDVQDAVDSAAKALGAMSSEDKRDELGGIAADISALREMISETNKTLRADMDKLSQKLSKAEKKISETSAIAESAAEAVEAVQEKIDEEPVSASVSAPKIGAMMSKALNGAQSSKASVEKFMQMGKSSEESPVQEPETVIAEDGGTIGEFPEPDTVAIPGETAAQPEAAAADSAEKPAEKSADFFEPADSAVHAPESARPKDTPHPDVMLFEELPESHAKAPKPSKGDTVITVNALIGIGNKPFLRGSGAGLSLQKGAPMDFVEIGKWRHVLPEFDGELKFSVLKNDATPANGDADFSISPGQKVNLNLSFPLED